MDKETLKKIILEQKETFEKEMDWVQRPLPEKVLKSPKIVIITGVRRCGKSTLLRQASQHYQDYGYINFEDERLLNFTHEDFNTLLEAFLELKPKAATFFFDEIQNVKGWEMFARRLFTDGHKLFITGSNARLLSSEIATALTGRNIKLELYPFSFKEYLHYSKFQIKEIYTTKEMAIISVYLKDYITYGGFPEIVASQDFEELNGIYQDVIIKDLLVRFLIRDTKDFRELALYLLSNIAQKISFNNLKNLLGFSNTSKVKNYIDFLSEAYLFFTVFKYEYSMKKQIKNDRKIYVVDSGIANAISFNFGKEEGKIIENIVFLELKRQKHEVYYYQGHQECDFVIRQGAIITTLVQVALTLSNPDTREREINGLTEAMAKFKLEKGFIITYSEEETVIVNAKKIHIVPLWKFLLYGLEK